MSAAAVELDPLAVFLPRLPPGPYPGLRPFEVEEWPIFCGRERMTDEAIALLLERRLVVVHGASGGGKSSLVRAGVQARLQQEYARSGLRWRTCAMRPGGQPLANLTRALAELAPDVPPLEIRRTLNRGADALEAASRHLRLGSADRVCILLDQFEELFRFAREVSREESSLLTDLLVGFERSPVEGIYVLVTMRSEFLGECARFEGLPEAFNRAQYLLPRMTTEDLLRAVREPALLYDGQVTEALAERLVADARGGQDELPLIQHGLARLWGFATERGHAAPTLDLPDYEAKGPLGRLLSEHADLVADQAAGDESGQMIVRELFRALTDINPDGHAIRRPQTFAALRAVTGASAERLLTVLAPFRAPGVSFVAPFLPDAIDDETVIDISHEALIRRWQRIADPARGWLQEEFRDGLIWRALLVQAESFRGDPRNLLSEATTETRASWIKGRSEAWARRYGGQWDSVGELIAASQREVEREHAEAETARRQHQDLLAEQERSRRRRRALWMTSIVSMACLLLAASAVWQWRDAVYARLQADGARQLAETERNAAVDARNEAESARIAAQASEQEALAARLKAEQALEDARRAEQQKAVAVESAARTEQASGQLLIKARTGNDAPQNLVATTIDQLQSATDPFQIAVLAQSLASLPEPLSAGDSLRVTEVLMSSFIANSTDPSATTALGRALEALLPKLDPNALVQAAQAVAPTLTPIQAKSTLAILRSAPPDETGALDRVREMLFARSELVAPRLYIQIAEEDQRPAAEQLKQALQGARIDGAPLVIPEIDLKPSRVAGGEVRCFRPTECRDEAPQIVAAVKAALARPEVRLADASATYAKATNIRDRTYELWLGPGPLQLAADR